MRNRLTLRHALFTALALSNVCWAEKAPSTTVLSAAASNNALAFDLYAQASALHPESANFAFAPISISSALSMTLEGARGVTATQMNTVLHLPTGRSDAVASAGHLLKSIEASAVAANVDLKIANRLFGARGFHFEPEFLHRSARVFGAPLESLDFARASEKSRLHINQWVETQTENRIKDLLPMGGISANTSLVLTNAVYFSADWNQTFAERSTHPAAFQLTETKSVLVPTMSQLAVFRFIQNKAVSVLEMPYVGGTTSMLFVLPDKSSTLAALEATLEATLMDQWLHELQPQQVFVYLPKFEINSTERLSKHLASLGMPLAFDASTADFSGIAKPSSNGAKLSISEVFHQAFIKVDEVGTEAAAATAVVVETTTAMFDPNAAPIAQFRADRPFVFVLREVATGAILFIGRVGNPSSGFVGN